MPRQPDLQATAEDPGASTRDSSELPAASSPSTQTDTTTDKDPATSSPSTQTDTTTDKDPATSSPSTQTDTTTDKDPATSSPSTDTDTTTDKDPATSSPSTDTDTTTDKVDETAEPGYEEETPEDPPLGAGWLIQRRLEPVPDGCGSPFVVPGEGVGLSAGGFAPDSEVSFTARGVTVSGSQLTSITIPPTTADGEGLIDVVWGVPEAPPTEDDPEPRAYIAEAEGMDTSGAALVAYMIEPLVAYPGTPTCAVSDSAVTGLGQPVRIPVLANDVAPDGGSLDPASVDPRPVAGGELTVDAADGSLTFTPDPGFAGSVAATYVVYDNWRIGVQGEVTLTVEVDCTITIAEEMVEVVGTEGDDVMCADDLGDTSSWEDYDRFHVIDALGGDDIILGSNGTDWIYAGERADVVYGRAGDDRIVVDDGDKIYGGPGYDTIYSVDLPTEIVDSDGGYHIELSPVILFEHVAPIAVDDHRHVDSFATRVIEVLDNDHDPNEDLRPLTLSIEQHLALGSARVVDSLHFGSAIEYTARTAEGADTLSYSVCDFLSGCTVARLHVTIGSDHCTIMGTEGPDTLRGTPGDDVICGLGGNDRIEGLGGNDLIIAGPGNDTVVGGPGDDRIWGGDGNDTLEGGTGADTLWGGAGSDSLDGGAHDDALLGGDGDDRGAGGDGDDRLWGGAGDDTLDGGDGRDTLWGGPGHDTLNGGPGGDTLWGDASYGVGDDTLDGGDGDDTLLGDLGRNTLKGGAGNDAIRGGLSDDTIQGGAGNDEILGSDGNDHIQGGVGNDRIHGGYGDDAMDGGEGTDYLDGDDGTDTCLNGEVTGQCEG